MSDYRRFVSYMYLYENNIKSMNAGFLKVESRNGQCRFNLTLKNVYTITGKCSVYLFMREGDELRGVYMGEIQIKNHGSQWNFCTDSQNIAGAGYSLDHMSGMIILCEDQKFYGTRWDTGDLDIRRFVTEWDKDAGVTCEEMKELPVKMDLPAKAEEKQKMDVQVEASEQTDKRCIYFGKMLEQCPGMYPFDDDAIEACVRLEPQDIGMMPLDCWSYGSNSFLLHGYYSYRHLILARMKMENDTVSGYILGVPGTQHSRDAFMAHMFGFRKFKPIRSDEESPGNFGYWYTFL